MKIFKTMAEVISPIKKFYFLSEKDTIVYYYFQVGTRIPTNIHVHVLKQLKS